LERGRLARFVFFAGGTLALHYEKHLSSSRVVARIGRGDRSEPRHRPLTLAHTGHLKMEEISSLIGRHDEAIQKACFLLGFASLNPTY
jgi:hypothetical protein